MALSFVRTPLARCHNRRVGSNHGVQVEALSDTSFWVGIVKIIWINAILSGDNAVVIALAAKSLPAHQQRLAVFWGSGAAVVLRVALTAVAAQLLELPWLQIAGGVMLLWIGAQLLAADEEEHDGTAQGQISLMAAVRTILVADLVMSLDNVIAVAAAAGGSLPLLVFGLAISIPIVIFGATLMVGLMGRFPILVDAGAALIGWVAGETIMGDQVLRGIVPDHGWPHWAAAMAGAVIVLAAGRWMAARAARD
jgi:YjbE family integral membrane protein